MRVAKTHAVRLQLNKEMIMTFVENNKLLTPCEFVYSTAAFRMVAIGRIIFHYPFCTNKISVKEVRLHDISV